MRSSMRVLQRCDAGASPRPRGHDGWRHAVSGVEIRGGWQIDLIGMAYMNGAHGWLATFRNEQPRQFIGTHGETTLDGAKLTTSDWLLDRQRIFNRSTHTRISRLAAMLAAEDLKPVDRRLAQRLQHALLHVLAVRHDVEWAAREACCAAPRRVFPSARSMASPTVSRPRPATSVGAA